LNRFETILNGVGYWLDNQESLFAAALSLNTKLFQDCADSYYGSYTAFYWCD